MIHVDSGDWQKFLTVCISFMIHSYVRRSLSFFFVSRFLLGILDMRRRGRHIQDQERQARLPVGAAARRLRQQQRRFHEQRLRRYQEQRRHHRQVQLPPTPPAVAPATPPGPRAPPPPSPSAAIKKYHPTKKMLSWLRWPTSRSVTPLMQHHKTSCCTREASTQGGAAAPSSTMG